MPLEIRRIGQIFGAIALAIAAIPIGMEAYGLLSFILPPMIDGQYFASYSSNVMFFAKLKPQLNGWEIYAYATFLVALVFALGVASFKLLVRTDAA